MAAIGNATRHGFLVREGDALERLAQVRRVCFDKTGTLTTGEPQVVAVCAGEKDVSEDALLAVAGAAEKRSEHPSGAPSWPRPRNTPERRRRTQRPLPWCPVAA